MSHLLPYYVLNWVEIETFFMCIAIILKEFNIVDIFYDYLR